MHGRTTYSGTAAGGTLSVTDGSRSANIALIGNYLASTFVASSDGHGGTSVSTWTVAKRPPLGFCWWAPHPHSVKTPSIDDPPFRPPFDLGPCKNREHSEISRSQNKG